MKLITQLSWLLRVLLFLAVFAFALMNTGPVTLRFFLGQTWETPMILVLLLAFAFGAAIGVLACLSRMLGLRSPEQFTAAPRPADAPAWVGGVYTDAGGTRWHELDLPALVREQRFLEVGA